MNALAGLGTGGPTGKGLLIDTEVLIDYIAGREQASDFLEYARDDLHLSAVTLAEIGPLVRNDAEWQNLDAALAAFIVHPVDKLIARTAASLRGRTLAHRLIAATATIHELRVVSRDKKFYPDSPNVLVPYQKII